MARDITIGRDTYRFVYDHDARGGCYKPEIHVYRTGPNGSPAGRGPKGFPAFLGFLRPYYADRDRWLGMLAIPIPHLTFRTAYKLRRFGGLQLYCANSWLMAALDKRHRQYVWPWKTAA